MIKSACLPLRANSSASLVPKKSMHVDTLLNRGRRDIGGRLDAQRGHAKRDEMLQQVSIVACKFHDQAVAIQIQSLLDHFAIRLRVRHPGRRIGGEIGILPKYAFRRHILLELDQQAIRAHIGMQRIKRLHAVRVGGLDERIGQRRHAQIDEAVLQLRATEPAFAVDWNLRR
jgi:hypothetical protein